MFGLKIPKALKYLEAERAPQRAEVHHIEARHIIWQRHMGNRTNLNPRRLVVIERELSFFGFTPIQAMQVVREAVDKAAQAFNTHVENEMAKLQKTPNRVE